ASGVRTYDNVSRIGPDEFGLVLPGMEPEVARALLERLSAAFASSAQGATVSAGVAAFPADGDTQGELVRLATGALYWARRGGAGRVTGGRGCGGLRRVGRPRLECRRRACAGRPVAATGRVRPELHARARDAPGRPGRRRVTGPGAGRLQRLDLHNHTHHSYDAQLTPFDYRRAHQAGLIDVVAITDHNTITGALELCEQVGFPV